MKRFRGEGWALLGMIWALAWPTMLEQLMSTAVQYVDAAMVGRLGAQATAAVGATTTVSWLIGSTVSALGIGFLSFIAQAYGADDRARAARTSSQAVLAVLCTLIMARLCVHEAEGRLKNRDAPWRFDWGRGYFERFGGEK